MAELDCPHAEELKKELQETHLAPESRAEVEVLKQEERKSMLEFSKRLLNKRRHKPE